LLSHKFVGKARTVATVIRDVSELLKVANKIGRIFCNTIPKAERNNVVEGQPARMACHSHQFSSETEKKNWCYNQYGKGIVDGGAVEVDATERDDLFAMLGSFERQVIPGCEK
jgi:hypothetical protein